MFKVFPEQRGKSSCVRHSRRCAIEGRYPSGVAYLKENYGLVVDEEKYVIHYQNMGDNLLPEIAVFLIEDGFDGQQ